MQPERLHEPLAQLQPIDVRVSDEMRIEVAHGAIDLPADRDRRELRPLLGKPVREICDLLAQGRRRCGLAMRARHHCERCSRVRERAQARDQRIEPRQQHLIARFAQHQRIAQIVDVFRCAREVHEFPLAPPRRHGIEPALYEILDRLHVVIRLALDALDFRGVRIRELGGKRIENRERCGGHAAKLGNARLRHERSQPERLDTDALAYQPPLAEEGAKLGGFVGIAPIDRGNGVEWRGHVAAHCKVSGQRLAVKFHFPCSCRGGAPRARAVRMVHTSALTAKRRQSPTASAARAL